SEIRNPKPKTEAACFEFRDSTLLRISRFGFRISPLHDFRCQTHDLQVAAVTELAGDGAEDARAPGILVFLVQDDHGIAVEADVAAVVAAGRPLDAHDHALDHVARLDVAAGNRLLDAGDDQIAQPGIAALVAAEDFDAHAFLGASVIGDVQIRIHLNHDFTFRPDFASRHA